MSHVAGCHDICLVAARAVYKSAKPPQRNGGRGFRQSARSLPSDVRRYQTMAGFMPFLPLGQFRLLQCDGVSFCSPTAPGPLYFNRTKTTADPHASQTRMDRMDIH
jgi:hypothetical protein